MKIVNYVVFGILSLVFMLLCSTAVMKILDIMFQLGYENIWAIGCKVGLVAWIGLAVFDIMTKKKGTENE